MIDTNWPKQLLYCEAYWLSLLYARINIPALSESTIRRDIARSDVTLTTDIQVSVIADIVINSSDCIAY